MSPEDIKQIPRAAVGLTTGFVRYFVLRPIVDRVERFFDEQMIDMEEIDKLIMEIGNDHDSSTD